MNQRLMTGDEPLSKPNERLQAESFAEPHRLQLGEELICSIKRGPVSGVPKMR
jgi:hypothetical protein